MSSIQFGNGAAIIVRAGGGATSTAPQVSTVYFGDPNTNGTWRIITSGSNLSFQFRVAGTYIEKAADTP